MFLVIAGLLIGAWLLFMGWKFYQNIDWTEPADPSPDLQGMRKREAQLLHIQDVVADAGQQGKISKECVQEFTRFCESEIQDMRTIETTWKNRHKASSVEGPTAGA